MQILAHFCFLIAAYSILEVYKRFFLVFLGLLMMDCVSFLKSLTQSNDFGCGFLVFGYFPQVFNSFSLILMFLLGLKFLQCRLHGRGLIRLLCDIRGKSSGRRNGLCSKIGFGEECDAKIVSCNCGPLKFLENSKSVKLENSMKSRTKEPFNQNIENVDDDDDKDERQCCEEDQVYDVIALRKLVRIQRQRANVALTELEKDRMAAASAADEAMAMILRLQNEKSSIEIESNQYRRLAEQKQQYDREVIQSLQWIVMKHESERGLLEDKLRLWIRKLKHHVKDDEEMDQLEEFDTSLSTLNSTVEHNIHYDDGFISSLDMESSEW